MKIQYVAKDGTIFANDENDLNGEIAKFECEYYEQEQLGIDHGLWIINPYNLYDALDE